MCDALEIQKHIQIIGVFGENPEGIARSDDKCFFYSFGMEKYELPDVMVRDVPQFLSLPTVHFLNSLCQAQKDKGKGFEEGDLVSDERTFVMRAYRAGQNWRNNPLGVIELVPEQVNTCDHDHYGEDGHGD